MQKDRAKRQEIFKKGDGDLYRLYADTQAV